MPSNNWVFLIVMIIETHALCQCAKIVCEYILREKKFFERNLRGDFIVLVRKSS